MKRIRLLLATLLITLSSYAQTKIKPFDIHYRDQSTNWEFVNIEGHDVPYLYMYFNNQTDIRKKLTRVSISNGWKDEFIILEAGDYVREDSGMKWKAMDRDKKYCTLEMVSRKHDRFSYMQLYIRYTNIEYVYSFTTN